MITARIVAVVIGYILGLFQTGYLYGKSKGVDIRQCGSGNSGTTNTLRTLGWKAGLITFAGDFIKAMLAVIIVRLIWKDSYPDAIKVIEMYAGFGAVLGHNFPVTMNFKGGKGIACTAGVIIAVCLPAAPVCLVLFVGAVLLTGYVSLGSILVVTAFFIQSLIFNHMGLFHVPAEHILEFEILVGCFTAMAIWRHRANIVRLMNGTENKLFKKKTDETKVDEK